MYLLADYHFDWRRAKHSVILGVPPCAGKKRMTCRRQCREIRHRRAGDQSSRAIPPASPEPRIPSPVPPLPVPPPPATSRAVRHSDPTHRQPICRQRTRVGSANYKAKVSSAGRRHRCWRADFIQHPEDLHGIAWRRGKSARGILPVMLSRSRQARLGVHQFAPRILRYFRGLPQHFLLLGVLCFDPFVISKPPFP